MRNFKELRRVPRSLAPPTSPRVVGRKGERELGKYLSTAAGSASEAEYQFMLARDLTYVHDDAYREVDSQVSEVKRMLNSFMLGQRLIANC